MSETEWHDKLKKLGCIGKFPEEGKFFPPEHKEGYVPKEMGDTAIKKDIVLYPKLHNVVAKCNKCGNAWHTFKNGDVGGKKLKGWMNCPNSKRKGHNDAE